MSTGTVRRHTRIIHFLWPRLAAICLALLHTNAAGTFVRVILELETLEQRLRKVLSSHKDC